MSATSKKHRKKQHEYTKKVAAMVAEEPEVAYHAYPTHTLRKGLPFSELRDAVSPLGISQDVVTRVLGVSERTLQRRRKSGKLSPSESDRVWRIKRIHSLALSAFDGNEDEAREWLTTPKRALGGDTPIEHLDTEPGLRLVEQMLTGIIYFFPA